MPRNPTILGVEWVRCEENQWLYLPKTSSIQNNSGFTPNLNETKEN